jgi:hypothetical protein
MALTTYATLQTAIGDWLNRTDLTSAIPDFIQMAEAQFQRSIRHRKQITRSTATLDQQYNATPADWIQTVSLILTTNPVTALEYVTQEAMNTLRAGSSGTAKPKYFTMVGTEVELYPSPSGTFTGELVYYATIPVLSDSNTSNWLLDLSPDIYLYGSLLQSAPYLQDDARLGVWGGMYEKMIEDMNISNERSQGQTSVKMKAAALQ